MGERVWAFGLHEIESGISADAASVFGHVEALEEVVEPVITKIRIADVLLRQRLEEGEYLLEHTIT